jgi:hypothetical protein
MVEEVFMKPQVTYNNNDAEKTLKVRRGRVDSVDLYEIKENELDILEKGESSSIYLNFSIFLLSISATGIVALCTATFKNDLTKYSFLFVSILGIIIGLLLLALWYKERKSIITIVKRIRERIPPEYEVNVQESLTKEHIEISLAPSQTKIKNAT